MTDTSALRDPRLQSLTYQVTRHGPVGSLEEAAETRGVTPGQVLKTMVVRRADEDYLFVLVPGDRNISWPKLRSHLGVNRVSMPDAADALRVTGYERGTITPLGSTGEWPVLADERITGLVSIGAGENGVSLQVDGTDLIRVPNADVADVTDPV